ncbi:MAG TPA: site-2 protease family protein [Pyrinomonadaceae bacterium]|nr:site-2 protease family protein [Pyrinomonadaceae bacterium]
MRNFDVGQFILYMVALVFSLSLHEAGHAWMSSRFGDDLARSQGRISLNPISHVDPIGTLLFPGLAFFTGAPLLGWARPTPVNPLRWRNKRVANFWVSIAGVLGNLSIALVSGIIIRVLYSTGVIDFGGRFLTPVGTDSPIAVGAVELLFVFFTLNIGLAVFNLIPIPPLDGSKILSSILPESFESAINALEQFGFVLLFIAVFTGVFSAIFRVVMPFAIRMLFIGVPLEFG